jgi:hypothetical protein
MLSEVCAVVATAQTQSKHPYPHHSLLGIGIPPPSLALKVGMTVERQELVDLPEG